MQSKCYGNKQARDRTCHTDPKLLTAQVIVPGSRADRDRDEDEGERPRHGCEVCHGGRCPIVAAAKSIESNSESE